MKHIQQAPGAPPVRGYSHAVTAGSLVVVSGQVPVGPDGRVVGEGDAERQVRQVFDNLRAVLEAAGTDLAHLVKLTVYLKDLADLETFRRVRDESLDTETPPASSLVQVAGLVDPAFRLEVDAVAVLPDSH